MHKERNNERNIHKGKFWNYESLVLKMANRYEITKRSEVRKKIEATRLETISFQLDLSSPSPACTQIQLQRVLFNVIKSVEHMCRRNGKN